MLSKIAFLEQRAKTQLSTVNGHFSEQRVQSDACISYAESRRDWSEAQRSMVNGQRQHLRKGKPTPASGCPDISHYPSESFLSPYRNASRQSWEILRQVVGTSSLDHSRYYHPG
ncbi:MAG: hypothetical protein J6U14_11140 [Bacteroidaceae bacterium]|nr:hypothetical protein [Bacteroidaceae bacterium]